MKRSIKQMFGRRFRAGSYAAFAAVIVIAIAVVCNLLVSALPSDVTQIDMTASSLYTLSDQSRRIVSALDKDVTLYLLATTGNEDSSVTRLLDRYESLSGHVKVEYVDPAVKPAFLNNYDLSAQQLYANSVLVESGEKYRLVGYDEIYVTSYSMDSYSYYGYSTTTEFDGENALTNAIHYVTSDNLPKLYQLSGHGESELSTTITEMIEQDNMEVETLSLLSLESVPEDASAIIIHAPTGDLSEDEADMLIAYLQNGGNIMLVTDYIASGEMTNLLKVTSAMGLTTDEGIIIEGDAQMSVSRYPYYLLPNIESHTITDPISEGRYYILTPLAQPIVATDSSEATVTWLLSTSDSAYSKLDAMAMTTTEKEDNDLTGPFYVGAVSEWDEGKLTWFSSGDLLNDQVNAMVSGANGNLFLNALNWMCEQEESISIRAKSLESATLTVTSAENSLWSILLVGVVPLAFIGVGIIVWIRRKRR